MKPVFLGVQMVRKISILGAVLLLGAGTMFAAPGGDFRRLSFREANRKAQRACQKADAFYEAGKLQLAADAYEEARDAYRHLRRSHSDLNKRRVTYWINYTESQLDKVARTGGVRPMSKEGELKEREIVPGISVVELVSPLKAGGTPVSSNGVPLPVVTVVGAGKDDGPAVKPDGTTVERMPEGPVSMPTPSSPPGSDQGDPIRPRERPSGHSSKTTASAAVSTLLSKGRVAEARAMVLARLEEDPDDPEARLLAGMVSCRAGDFEDAVLTLESLQNEHDTTPVRLLLAGAYLGAGMREDARTLILQVVDDDPTCGEAYINLAYIRLTDATPSRKEASLFYRKALRLGVDPDPGLASRLEGDDLK